MNLDRRHFLRAAGLTAMGATVPSVMAAGSHSDTIPAATGSSPLPAAAKAADRPPLLAKAVAALDRHQDKFAHRDLIGLVDFSAHSSERRFQLVDVASGRITDSWLVAHGRGSDPGHTGYLQEFSNVSGSNATSRGAYRIANTYYGKYGRSRRLEGLDRDNSLALPRAIVIHGAPYVDPGLIETQGRIGRSFGCFSVAQDHTPSVLDRLGEGSLLYADSA